MKKTISKMLCITMLFSCFSFNNVLAGSTNSMGFRPQVQLGASELIQENVPSNLQIVPRDAVETGDSIILSVKNGLFDRDLMRRDPYIFRTEKTGTTYDEIFNCGLSTYDALVKYVGNEDSRQLPYKFKWINESELEVILYPISYTKVNQRNDDVTKGVPYYNIALPISLKDSTYGDIEVTIDDNGSSMTGNQTYICGKIVDEIEDSDRELSKDEYINFSKYYSERVLSVNAGEKILYREKPNALILTPTDEVGRNASVKIKIDNGKFDKSMVDMSQFVTRYSGSTYDDIVNSHLSPYEALIKYIGDEYSRELPYKITFVSEDTIYVDLYPIDDAYVNQNNSGVTQGVPIYKIYLPAVAGNKDGDVTVAVDGRKADMRNGGWYTIAKIGSNNDDYVKVEDIFAEREVNISENQPIMYKDKLNSLYIVPKNEIFKDESILIKVKNGSFSNEMIRTCQYRTRLTNTTYDTIVNTGLSSSDALTKYVGGEGGREIPYKIKIVDENTIKVELYPIDNNLVNQSNNKTTIGIPVYKIALPVVSGSQPGYTQVAVDGCNTAIPSAGYYTIANVSTEPEMGGGASGNIILTNTVYVKTGAEMISGSRPVNIQILPKIGINDVESIIVKVENGSFSKELIENSDPYSPYVFRTNRTHTTYDEIMSSDLSIYDALVNYIGNENSRLLPYKLNYISDGEMEVMLYPIPDNKVNQNNSDVTIGTPVYSIALPLIAGNKAGDVKVSIIGKNSVIKSAGPLVVGTVYDEATAPSATASVYSTSIITTDSTNIALPDITLKEDYPAGFKEGKIVLTAANGYKFDVSSTPVILAGVNAMFSNVEANITEKEISFNIGEKGIPLSSFDNSKMSSLIIQNISVVVDSNYFGDIIVNLSGSAAKNFNQTLKVAKRVSDGTETTTTVTRPSSGGGGGGGSYKPSTTTTTTEATTETTTAVVEKQTETTTVEKTDMPAISNVKVTIGNNVVEIGNEKFEIDVTPYIQTSSNSTLVPLRFVALAITGGDVANADSSNNILWNAETKTATILANGKTIEFTANSNIMTIDGNGVAMDNGVKAEISDGRMFVPFRALGQALGVNVDWDGTTKTAIYKVK